MNENRRNFLKKAGVGTAGILTFPTILPSAILGKSSPSNRINVAMIGCGRQTKDPNIPQLLASEHCQVVAVCDVDSRRMTNALDQVNDFYSAEKKRKYNGCVMYDDYRQLLLDKSIDAVMISSPDHWHVPMAIDAARHGKHISLEKPISTCIEHGRRLVEAIKKYKVITRNDSEFRTLPMFTRAVELVRNGRIGDLERIYVGVPPELSGAALPPQPTMPVPAELNYDMWLGPAFEAPYTENRVHPQNDYGRPGWMRVKDYCNGMISNWGAHLIGIAQWGNNSEYTGPVFITGTGDFDKGLWNTLNRFNIHYQFENGVEMYFRIERPYVRFEGTLGWVEIEYPDKLSASSQDILESGLGEDEPGYRNLLSDKEDFLHAIKTGTSTLEPLETAHRTISICQLGLISIQTGSKLNWNPDSEEILGDNAASALLKVPVREKYFSF